MRALILLLFLTGCTATQRAEFAISQHGPYCDKIGYQRDTDAWRNCVTQQQAGATAASQAASQAVRQKTCQVLQPGNVLTCY